MNLEWDPCGSTLDLGDLASRIELLPLPQIKLALLGCPSIIGLLWRICDLNKLKIIFLLGTPPSLSELQCYYCMAWEET